MPSEDAIGLKAVKLWDGSAYVGDGGRWGSFQINAWDARVLSFGGLRQTLTPQRNDFLTSFSQSELQSYSFVLDNTDSYFSRLFGDDRYESLVGQELQIRQGFETLSYDDFQSLFTGTVTEIRLTPKKLTVIAEQKILTGQAAMIGEQNYPWLEFHSIASKYITALMVYDDVMYVATSPSPGTVYKYDAGVWSTAFTPGATWGSNSMAVYNNKLYLGTSDAVHVYDGSTWSTSLVTGGKTVFCLCVHSNTLYAGAESGYIYSFDGSTWDTSEYSTGQNSVNTLCVYDSILHAGTTALASAPDGKVYRKVGGAWSELYDSDETSILSLATYAGCLYAGTSKNSALGKVLKYDGSSWTTDYNSTNQRVNHLYQHGDKLYAGCGSSAEIVIYDGDSWSVEKTFTESEIYALYVYQDRIYAGTKPNGKIFLKQL